MSKKPLNIRYTKRSRREDNAEKAQHSLRVTRAMAIIGNAATKAKVSNAIKAHDSKIPTLKPADEYAIWTKGQKEAVRKMEVALRRLATALNDSNLRPAIRADFPMDETRVDDWCKRLNGIAETKLQNVGPLDLGKQHAVQAAAELLKQHRVPLKTTRNGKFCRLAQVFYRKGPADFYQHCRRYLGPNQG